MSKQEVTLKARCVGCGAVKKLTSEQILEGEANGVVMSKCCSMPAIVESATIAYIRKPKKKNNKPK